MKTKGLFKYIFPSCNIWARLQIKYSLACTTKNGAIIKMYCDKRKKTF